VYVRAVPAAGIPRRPRRRNRVGHGQSNVPLRLLCFSRAVSTGAGRRDGGCFARPHAAPKAHARARAGSLGHGEGRPCKGPPSRSVWCALRHPQSPEDSRQATPTLAELIPWRFQVALGIDVALNESVVGGPLALETGASYPPARMLCRRCGRVRRRRTTAVCGSGGGVLIDPADGTAPPVLTICGPFILRVEVDG